MIILDIETTGEKPEKHGILSIGAIDFRKPKNQFYIECHVDPEIEIDTEALAVNGFIRREATDNSKPNVKTALENFFVWLSKTEDKTIAGQNISFDRSFINYNEKKRPSLSNR